MLIKCPECGRENVSDSAEMCPNCGYGIKAHFDKIKYEEERKKQIKLAELERERAEVEAKKREEDRIKSVPQLERPQLTAPIVILVISAWCFWLGRLKLGEPGWEVENSIANGNGDPHFYGGLFIAFGSGLVCYGIYLFSKRIKTYKLSKSNLEEYQRQVIREQDSAIVKKAPKSECPYCHSHNTTKITATSKAVSTAMFGVLGQKRKYQWHCNNCKSDF